MRPRLVLLAAAVLAAACGEPEIVERSATLVSPNGAEGAAVLEVRGDGIMSIEAEAGVLFAGPVGAVTRVVVVRDRPGSIILTMLQPDNLPLPTVTVLEVADSANALRSVAGYRVDVR